MTEVEEFMASLAPKGKLGAWEEHIFTLLAAGASYRQVVEYLATRDVVVSISTVHEFVHAQKRAKRLAALSAGLAAPAPVATPSEPITPVQASAAKTRPSGLPKFVWDDLNYRRPIEW